jgi:hypothetical protein
MSHYPPDQSFHSLCDELGLYVINELAGWQKAYDTPIGTKMVEELVVRDVNHPSVILWANGNEGGWNKELDDDYAKWDPQRRNVIHPWALHDEINTKHYPNYALLKRLLAGPDIVMPTEFLHALYDGGGGAGLWDYWEALRTSRVSAGGFIWALVDEGVNKDANNGPDKGKEIDVAGNAGPDGIVGPYREREGSFLAVKEIWSPVVLPRELPADFSGTVPVENRYDFSSLTRVKFHWQLRKWRGVDEQQGGFTVLSEGDAPAPDVAAGMAGALRLDLPDSWRSSDALAVTVTDWNGHEVWTSVWPVKKTADFAPRAGDVAAGAAPAGQTELRSGDAVLNVDVRSGLLRSVSLNGKQVPFNGGPRLALGAVRPEQPATTTATTTATTRNATTTTAPATRPAVAPVKGEMISAKWTPGADGWFRLQYAYRADGPCDFAGVTFDAPEEGLKSMRWLGDGPYRVWKNRTHGATLGVWENTINDTVTGHSAWKYPEFKGYFGNLHWTTLRTDAGSITLAAETPGLYLRVGTPGSPGEKLVRTTGVAFPDGTVSLMHLIPAIGTKFNRPEKLGPASEPNQAKGTYEGTVWIRFGA